MTHFLNRQTEKTFCGDEDDDVTRVLVLTTCVACLEAVDAALQEMDASSAVEMVCTESGQAEGEHPK